MRATPALVTLVLAGCGPGRTTFARHPAAAPAFDRAGSDARAVAIADRVVAAAGGHDRWTQAKQLRWSESVTTGQAGAPPVTFEEGWDRWNGRHYNRMHAEVGDIVVMRNLYEVGGAVFGDTGHTKQPVAAADSERAIASARERWELDTGVLFLPFLLEEPGTKLALVGDAPGEAGAPPLDDLKVTFDPKDPTRTAVYHAMVNRTTNQIERIEIVKPGDPDTKRLGYKASSWVDAGGIKLATVYHNIGFAAEVVTYSNVAAATEPDDTLFVPTAQ